MSPVRLRSLVIIADLHISKENIPPVGPFGRSVGCPEPILWIPRTRLLSCVKNGGQSSTRFSKDQHSVLLDTTYRDNSADWPRPSAPFPSYPTPRAQPGFLLEGSSSSPTTPPRKSRETKRRTSVSPTSSSLSVSAKRYREEPQPPIVDELDVS